MLAALVVGHQLDARVPRMALEVRGRRGRHGRAGGPALDLAALAEAVLLASGQIGRNVGPIIEELPFVLARPVVDTFHTL